jgi:hypothetical protein
MRSVVLDLPSFGFVVGTRLAMAAGIGLMLSDRLTERQRRIVSRTLIAVGVVTTIPAAMKVMRGMRQSPASNVYQDERLVGMTRFPRKGGDAM